MKQLKDHAALPANALKPQDCVIRYDLVHEALHTNLHARGPVLQCILACGSFYPALLVRRTFVELATGIRLACLGPPERLAQDGYVSEVSFKETPPIMNPAQVDMALIPLRGLYRQAYGVEGAVIPPCLPWAELTDWDAMFDLIDESFGFHASVEPPSMSRFAGDFIEEVQGVFYEQLDAASPSFAWDGEQQVRLTLSNAGDAVSQ